MDRSLPGFSVHGDSPGKNTGVGCHALLQGIFLSQGLNPCLLQLLHWQASSVPLAPPGKLQVQDSERLTSWVCPYLLKGTPTASCHPGVRDTNKECGGGWRKGISGPQTWQRPRATGTQLASPGHTPMSMGKDSWPTYSFSRGTGGPSTTRLSTGTSFPFFTSRTRGSLGTSRALRTSIAEKQGESLPGPGASTGPARGGGGYGCYFRAGGPGEGWSQRISGARRSGPVGSQAGQAEDGS